MSNEVLKKPKTMYREEEQTEDVARGCVKVTQINAYECLGKKKDERGRVLTDQKGNDILIEKSVGKFFTQDKEDVNVFQELNPKLRIETFDVQLLKSTAIKYLNNPDNMKAFAKD